MSFSSLYLLSTTSDFFGPPSKSRYGPISPHDILRPAMKSFFLNLNRNACETRKFFQK